MTAFLTTALHNGSLWLVLACFVLFVGVGVGVYTRTGSGISAHPYATGGDMPVEATGREEMEQILRP
jgi:hypothetical protein